MAITVSGGMKKVKTAEPYLLAIFISLFVSFPAVSNSIVLDEAYTIGLVRGSVAEIIQGSAADVHPPLYYLILKLSQIFGGESLFKYRIVTAMGTYLNLLLVGATMVRKQWGCRTATLYILWFGLTYSTLEKTTYMRMYSWGAFFVTATAVSLFSYYKNSRKRDLITGIVMTLAAMYTHYYAVMAVFFIWLVLLSAVFLKQRKRTGYIFLGGIGVLAGYLPWLGKLLMQSRRVAQDYWMPDLTWDEWIQTTVALMETADGAFCGVGMVLSVFLAILFVLALVRRKWEALLCVLVFLCIMITGGLLSVFVTSIWAARYLYVAWGLIALFVAVTAGEMAGAFSDVAQGLLVAVLAVTGLFSLNTMLEDETMDNTADEWVAFLEDSVVSDAYFIVDDPAEHVLVYEVYLPEAEFVSTETLSGRDMEEAVADFLEQGGGHQLWYVNNGRQQKAGVDRMGGYLGDLGYSLNPAGSYTIEQKDLEVYRIEEGQHGK